MARVINTEGIVSLPFISSFEVQFLLIGVTENGVKPRDESFETTGLFVFILTELSKHPSELFLTHPEHFSSDQTGQFRRRWVVLKQNVLD